MAGEVKTRCCRAVSALLAVLALGGAAYAQVTSGTGAIHGRVTDETGAVLPGVTITVSGPSLQVPEIVNVTDADGSYRFSDLSAGVFSIRYQLQGFQPIVREDFRLNVGFVARADVVLKVGSLEEAVTVSGQSPVIDLEQTAAATNFTSETLQSIPTSKSIYEIVSATPGIRALGLDVGGSSLAQMQTFVSYGSRGQMTPLLEGLSTRNGPDGSSFFFDFDALEEVEIKPIGNGPEVGLPGISWMAIVKSGGNDFHGRYVAAGQHSSLQSSNVSDALRAQGIGQGNALKYFYDFGADLGGRVVRDKLWFYGAIKRQRSVRTVIAYSEAPGADGNYGTADDVPGQNLTDLNNETIKASYQPTSKYKIIGFYQRQAKIVPEQSGGRFRPFEATNDYLFVPEGWKGEIQGTLTNNLVFNWFYGWEGHLGAYNPQDTTLASRFDRNTQMNTGATTTQDQRHREHKQSQGSLSYFPPGEFFGKHALKAGYTALIERHGNEFFDRPTGNYRLVYDAGRPAEINTYNLPIPYPKNRLTDYAGYLKDTWTSGRITMNLGLRFERIHSFVDEQSKPQGQFGNAGEYPAVQVRTWVAVAPRFGFAFDLAGDGRNVVKATYGRFNHTMADEFAGNFNQNTLSTTTYRWRDEDGNNDYTPGEVNLDVNGPDFLSVSGASNTILNPDMKQPYTHEVTAGYERELASNFSAKALYVFKQQNNLFEGVNVLRPLSAWNIPLSRRDPGADGLVNTSDDGSMVTIYDYDPAYRGAQFVGTKFLNRSSDRADSFHTMELTLNRRSSSRWSMLASFGATKNNRWLVGIPENPNQETFPLDETWDTFAKATGTYVMPYDIQFGAFYQYLAGAPQARTYIFRAADPLGGPPLRQQTTVTMTMEPLGAQRNASQNLLNLRASRRFPIGGGRRVEFTFDVFNTLNSSAATAVSYESGPTYGAISAILPPRVLRLGTVFSF